MIKILWFIFPWGMNKLIYEYLKIQIIRKHLNSYITLIGRQSYHGIYQIWYNLEIDKGQFTTKLIRFKTLYWYIFLVKIKILTYCRRSKNKF